MPALGNLTVVIEHPQDVLQVPAGNDPQRLTNAVATFLERFAAGLCVPTTRVTLVDGGAQASGTVTLSGAVGVRATGTVTYSSASGTTTATVNGVAFSQTTGTDAARAAALAAAIMSSTDPLVLGLVSASANAGVVTLTATTQGTGGNALTLVVSGTGIARSAATLTGGTNNTVTTTVAGVAVAVVTTTQQSDVTAAAAIAAAINASTNPALAGVVRATSSGAVVTIRAIAANTGGNAITLAVTGTGVTASGATLSGGANGTTIALVR